MPVRFSCALAALVLLAAGPARAQDCPQAYYTLTTQAAVDAFPATCTRVTGGIAIQGADIRDLAPLGALTSVGTHFTIQHNGALTSLDGLDGLTSVGTHFIIIGNAALTSLDGLDALTSVASLLFIRANRALAECAVGLRGVISGDPPAFTGVGSALIAANAPDGRCNTR